MAKGRMLNQSISESRAVHELSSDTCRLAFTWTLPYLDVEGRVVGEANLLRAKVFPRRVDISDTDMQSFIHEWCRKVRGDTPLAVRYKGPDGDRVLWFPGFQNNQPGIRKERETASQLAGPTPALLRHYSGNTPAESKRKEVQEKVREGDSGTTPALLRHPLVKAYAKLFYPTGFPNNGSFRAKCLSSALEIEHAKGYSRGKAANLMIYWREVKLSGEPPTLGYLAKFIMPKLAGNEEFPDGFDLEPYKELVKEIKGWPDWKPEEAA